MGCCDSERADFEKVNLYEPQKRRHKRKTHKNFVGSRTGKGRIHIQKNQWRNKLGEIWDAGFSDDPFIYPKESRLCGTHQKIGRSVVGTSTTTSEGSLSRAIELLEFGKITPRETSYGSISFTDLRKDQRVERISFEPEITKESVQAIPSVNIAESNALNSSDCNGKMILSWTCNPQIEPGLMGQNYHLGVAELQSQKTNDHDHEIARTNFTPSRMDDPQETSVNPWQVKNSSGGGNFQPESLTFGSPIHGSTYL